MINGTQPTIFRIDESKASNVGGRKIGKGPFIVGMTPLPNVSLRIFGATKDSTGTPIASATVSLFRTADQTYVESQVSDASGNYEFRSASLSTQYYVVAYKVGSPDLAGTTVNTLTGS